MPLPNVGVLPELDLSIPQRLDFGFRLVNAESSVPFKVENVGKADVRFSWRIAAPFKIAPLEGHLTPGETKAFTCTFQPEAASVFTANAVCIIAGGPTIPMRVQGIGKYAFVVIDRSSVDLGTCVVGSSCSAEIVATNASTVPADFEVACIDPASAAFRVSPLSGTIAPGANQPIKIHFAPQFGGLPSADQYTRKGPGWSVSIEDSLSKCCDSSGGPHLTSMSLCIGAVRVTGGNRVSFEVKAQATLPQVSLSSSCVNFGSVEAGQTVKRALQIRNESASEINFQIVCEPGVFAFEKTRGVLPPFGIAPLFVSFCADNPSQYWRRAGVILHGGSPVYVDLLAAAFTKDNHPMVPSETQARLGWTLGLRDTRALLSEAPGTRLDTPGLQPWTGFESLASTQAAMEAGPVPAWDAAFRAGAASSAVSVDMAEVHFGSCSRLRAIEPKLITVTNRSSERLTVFWGTQGQLPVQGVQPPVAKVFHVLPERGDVEPGGKTTFRVAFRPPKDSTHYYQSLDLFVTPRRPLAPTTINPRILPQYLPLHMSIPASGHTFTALVRTPCLPIAPSQLPERL